MVSYHAKVLLVSGPETYEKGKTALQTWRHFRMNWAFVDPKAAIQTGVKFCACVNEFIPWLMMPLQIAYGNIRKPKIKSCRIVQFCWRHPQRTPTGWGRTLFNFRWMRTTKFGMQFFPSQSQHTFFRYPYALLRQKYFAHQSSDAVRKFVPAR